MLDIKALFTKITQWIQGDDRYYSGSWTATSSAATNVQLTEVLTLPVGTYMIIINSPLINTNNVLVALSINGSTDAQTECHLVKSYYSQAIYIEKITTASSTVKLITQSSASVSYTNTERGVIKAIRLCG